MTDFAPPLKDLGKSGIGVASAPTGGMGLALDDKGRIPIRVLPGDVYSASASADLTLSTTPTLVTGCTAIVVRTGTYLVIGTFDFNITAAGPVFSVGQLFVGDALGASNQAVLADAAVRATTTQSWLVTVNAGNAVQLYASKSVNAGTSKALQTHTNLTVSLVGP